MFPGGRIPQAAVSWTFGHMFLTVSNTDYFLSVTRVATGFVGSVSVAFNVWRTFCFHVLTFFEHGRLPWFRFEVQRNFWVQSGWLWRQSWIGIWCVWWGRRAWRLDSTVSVWWEFDCDWLRSCQQVCTFFGLKIHTVVAQCLFFMFENFGLKIISVVLLVAASLQHKVWTVGTRWGASHRSSTQHSCGELDIFKGCFGSFVEFGWHWNLVDMLSGLWAKGCQTSVLSVMITVRVSLSSNLAVKSHGQKVVSRNQLMRRRWSYSKPSRLRTTPKKDGLGSHPLSGMVVLKVSTTPLSSANFVG